jgi:hypothetical protein
VVEMRAVGMPQSGARCAISGRVSVKSLKHRINVSLYDFPHGISKLESLAGKEIGRPSRKYAFFSRLHESAPELKAVLGSAFAAGETQFEKRLRNSRR